MADPNDLSRLSSLLTLLSEDPYSFEIHTKHIQLASLPGLEDQFEEAVKLFIDFAAATDQVWLPFLQKKIQRLGIPDNFETLEEPKLVSLEKINLETILDILETFQKAENDYLSISILKKEIHLLTLLHSSFIAGPSNPELESLLSEDAVRQAIGATVSRGSFHLTQGHILWELQVEWELTCLAEKERNSPERDSLIAHVDSLHLERLQQPHSANEQTLQSYSAFVSKYYSPEEYETRLVSASKMRTGPAKAWRNKERYEMALGETPSREAYQSYIYGESRAKPQNVSLVNALYERAIADFAKRRWEAVVNSPDAQVVDEMENNLRLIWCNHIDTTRSQEGGKELEIELIRRAIRSVPGCGDIWAKYIRALERSENEHFHDGLVEDAYTKALSTRLLQKNANQIVPVVMAKAGYDYRRAGSDEGFETLINTLEDGIDMVRKCKGGDPTLSLEKYYAGIVGAVIFRNYMGLDEPFPEKVIQLWEDTAEHYKTSYLAWSKYAEILIAERQYLEARSLFEDVSHKAIDWPEAIWQLWIEFENLHGSLKDVEKCLEEVGHLTAKMERQRATEVAEAQKAWVDASRLATETQEVKTATATKNTTSEPMVVDNAEAAPSSDRKRKAEDETPAMSAKRSKFDDEAPLKRDRENSTVFVSSLPAGTTDADLLTLFKDCGNIREVKITKLAESLVATVEFTDRESVPAALTKDKKRIQGEEIGVHLAWKSTLYVTNFPEATDDMAIRELFGQHGDIFDVRWPSKKYKSTRRFCYVQFITPAGATSALSLHGHELEADRKLTVYISDPARKQERSDASANAREIYVAGLSKFVNEHDLKKLFQPFGSISSVRLALDEKGFAKGFAFVEYDDKESANAALAANNQELKKRRIAVTLADTRAQPRLREGPGVSQSRRSCTVRVKNLPPGTQEGLLQQTLEKLAKVIRIEVFHQKNEAVIELNNPAEVGRLLLNPEPIIFADRELQLIEEDLPASSRKSSGPGPMFVPRGAAGRPRAGIGSKKTTNNPRKAVSIGAKMGPSTLTIDSGLEKGQDDFRRMLDPSA